MARDFNGSTDRIDWASIYTPGANPITVAAWVYFDTVTPATPQYIWHVGTNTNTPSFAMMTGTSGDIRVFVSCATTSQVRPSANSTLSISVWTHLLFTWDGTLTDATTIHIYKNGAEVSYATSTNGVGAMLSTAGSWSIGGRISDDTRNLNGRIAEIATWNRVLVAGEIASLANAYSPLFIPSGLKYYADLIAG